MFDLAARRATLIVGAFLMLLLAPGVQAQQTEPPDTTLLTQALQNTAAATSYGFSFTLRFDAAGIPNGGIALDINGSGTFARGEFGPSLDLVLNGTGHIGNRPAPTSVKVRIINGIFYFNLPGSDRWSGARLDELLPLAEDVMVSNFVQGFTGLSAGTTPVGTTNDPTTRAALDRVTAALSQVNFARYAAVERLPDESVDGAATGHFVAQIALADLARSDEIVALLVDLVRVGNPAQPDLSDTERSAVGALFSRIFSQSSLTLDQYAGLDDGFLHRWSAHGDVLIDPATLDRQGNAVHVGIDFDMRLTDFNQPATVDIPPNAFVISGLASALGLDSRPRDQNLLQPTVAAVPLSGQSIAANTPTTVSISSGAPADLIYSGQQGEKINVIARSLEQSGALDPEVTVLDTTNFQLAQNDDNTGGRANLQPFDAAIEGLTLPISGQYLIRVNTLSAEAQGRVEVTVETVVPPTPAPLPSLTFTPVPPTATDTLVPTDTPIPPTATATLTPTATTTFTPSPIPPTATPTLTPTPTPIPPQVTTLSDRIPEQGSYGYDFDVTAGQIVTITVHATGELDPKAILLAPDGSTAAENDDHEDVDSALNSYDARIADFTIPQTGKYHLQVTGFAGTGGPFDLSIVIVTPSTLAVAVATAAPTSPTDHQEIDGQIGLGQTFSANLDAQAGDVYTLTAESTDGDLDTLIDVLDAAGNVVVSSDNHGSNDPMLATTDARVDNWIAPTSGEYSVRVSGARLTAGSAILVIDRVATGAPLGPGQDEVVTGDVQPNNLFTHSFAAQAGDYVTITVRTLSAGLDPEVSLLDASGTVVAENDDHSMLDAALSDVDARISHFHVPANGQYTAQVAGFNNTGGSFALTITTLR